MELIMPMCGALLLQIICLLLQKTNMPLCLCRLQRADNNLIGRVMRLVSLLPNWTYTLMILEYIYCEAT